MLYSHQGLRHKALSLIHSCVHFQLAPYTFVLVPLEIVKPDLI
jgi:hypothetical protein